MQGSSRPGEVEAEVEVEEESEGIEEAEEVLVETEAITRTDEVAATTIGKNSCLVCLRAIVLYQFIYVKQF